MTNATETLVFDNEDIIITDPCYVIKGDNKEAYFDYLEKNPPYGSDKSWDEICEIQTDALKSLGYNKVLCADTVVGDWDCEVCNGLQRIGRFCADAGLVAVFSLDEIKRLNPEYDIKTEKKCGLATLIKGFSGKIFIENVFDDVRVEGRGTSKQYGSVGLRSHSL